jgi:Serine carboxypeptidase
MENLRFLAPRTLLVIAFVAGCGAGSEAPVDAGAGQVPDSAVPVESGAGQAATDSGGGGESDVLPTDSGIDAGVSFVTESGFFEVPAQPTQANFKARLFYSFHPADADPAQAPIALIFNGGPGFATSCGLLPYGTAPFSLDGSGDAAAPPIANSASWTSFANLLYVDMRLAGFSYGLDAPDASVGAFSPVEDASDFVRALLSFFVLHPALAANPVIVVGESYGGTRAQYFLDLVLRYPTEAAAGGSDLPGLLQAHFDAVFPAQAGSPFDEATIAKQFGRQILIQPLVLGNLQFTEQTTLLQSDPYVGASTPCAMTPQSCDSYDVQKPFGWSDGLTATAAAALSRDSSASLFLGQALESIAELQPAARTGAFHPAGSLDDGAEAPDADVTAVAEANATLAKTLGPLAPGDTYLVPESFATTDWTGEVIPTLFLENLASVKTFITDARYDPAILAGAIPAVLATAGFGGTVDETPRPGVARPGWFDVTSDAGGLDAEVRFPGYASSGHMVAVTQGQNLHDDVAAWLAE